MSTPPAVRPPANAVVEAWEVLGSSRAVLHAGLASAPQWAVLVPGFTGSKEDFIALPPLLEAEGFGMLTFDQVGQHESDGSDDPLDYTLAALAHDLGAIIEVASARFGRTDPPHLLGHSFGGLVAQTALIEGTVAPRSFTAFCTGPGALPERRWGALPDLAAALPHTDLAELWERRVAMDEENGVPAPPAEIQEFLRSRWVRNHPRQLHAFAIILMEQPSLLAGMQRIAAGGLPITVMWGEHDDAWPIRQQRAMAEDLGARCVELPGLGHSPNAEDPELTARALADAWRR